MERRTRGREIKGKKTKDKRPPRCVIYIFYEGNTEKIYLNHFSNRKYNVEIIPVDPKHTNAAGIVRFARQYIEKNKLDLKLGDRGYCGFDSDPESNPDIKEAFNMLWGCKGLYSIFSNPSFEVWFVLHFKNAPYGFSAGKMKDHLKKLVEDKYPDYSEMTDLYDYLLDKQQDALKRSRALHKIQSENFDTVYSHESNPYTDMFSFIEYMEEIKARNC